MWGGGETLSNGGRVGTGDAATVCQRKGQPSGAGPGLVTGSQGVQGEGSSRHVDERPLKWSWAPAGLPHFGNWVGEGPQVRCPKSGDRVGPHATSHLRGPVSTSTKCR